MDAMDPRERHKRPYLRFEVLSTYEHLIEDQVVSKLRPGGYERRTKSAA